MKSRSLLPLAEVALALVTVAAVYGFNRLFIDATYLPPLTAIAVGSHLVAAAARRRGIALPMAALLSAVGMLIVITWVLYPFTTTFGIPRGATLTAVRADMAASWDLFRQVLAPAPVDRGFLVEAGIAVWVCGFVADWAAFRLWVPFEAVIPAGTLFIFGSLFAGSQHHSDAAFVFVGAVIAFLLVQRVARQQASANWLTADVGRGSAALLKLGGWIGFTAIVIGTIVGPHLPGAGSSALLPWRDIARSPGSRQTISPLVQIKNRLISQSEVELFTVKSDVRSYWRLTSLDSFDGNVWSSKGSYGAAHGSLPDSDQENTKQKIATQEFNIEALAAIWLPAAFEPQSIDAPVTVRWEGESATLIVDTDQNDSDGMQYAVRSAVPQFDKAALSRSTDDVPGSIRRRYTELAPGTVSERVRRLAGQVTRSASTPYQKAIALQNYFRDNFRYTLNAPGGHSDSAMEEFLFDTKAGFCEQFAGSYAAMARAIGLPTRVAVGFTPGEQDASEPDTYHVQGKHAHAWPEVYFAGVGWVPFEPTPGRGAPGAQSYTGVPEEQVNAADPGSATTLATTGSTLPQDNGPDRLPTTTATSEPDFGPVPAAPHKDNALRRFWLRWRERVFIALLVLAGLIVLYLVAVPSALALRRRRRRARAMAPSDQVQVAWDETVEAVSLLGVEPRPAETYAEFGARAGRMVSSDAYPALADTAEAAAYSQEGVDEDTAAEAWALSGQISTTARGRATREQRVRAAFDPRPLLPTRRLARRKIAAEDPDRDRDHDRDRETVSV